jgi:hypothetical protein
MRSFGFAFFCSESENKKRGRVKTGPRKRECIQSVLGHWLSK